MTRDELVELLDAIVADRIGNATPPALVDAAGAAAQLGVPKSWVLAEARAGRIPHVRLGRYVRFEPAALSTWAATHRRGARS